MCSFFKKNKIEIFISCFLLLIGILGCYKKSRNHAIYQGTEEKAFIKYNLPRQISFCGEIVPVENQFVWESLDREFILEIWDRGQVTLWFKRTGHYFHYFEEKLRERGLPDDLKYVPVIESALIPDIGSYKGARGLWQLMKETARANGLRIDNTLDERQCYRKSTVTALKYLKDLYIQFGSWSLALAAYNCGETKLSREIQEQKINDYYNLILPRETERFVYRIVACKVILENINQYGFHLDENDKYKPYILDSITVNVSNIIKIHDIARAAGLSEKLFLFYNPQFISSYLPLHKYSIYIPENTKHRLQKALNSFSSISSNVDLKNGIYIVKPGDSLSRISEMTGVSIASLKKLNNLSNSHIWIGQKLRLK
jgi:hypothetical protein